MFQITDLPEQGLNWPLDGAVKAADCTLVQIVNASQLAIASGIPAHTSSESAVHGAEYGQEDYQ